MLEPRLTSSLVYLQHLFQLLVLVLFVHYLKLLQVVRH
jgi:hypothetical protein